MERRRPSSHLVEVTYSGISDHEVLVLENVWRERAFETRRRAVTAYLDRWGLPDEILSIIAWHTGCNKRGVDVRRKTTQTQSDTYVIEMAHVPANA